MPSTIILILGDQLSFNLAALRDCDPADTRIVMAEVRAETDYAPHHKKKIAFIFSAMRHFRVALETKGYSVSYTEFDPTGGPESLYDAVKVALDDTGATQLIVTKAGEWRLLDDMQHWQQRLGVAVTLLDDDRFIATTDQFAAWAKGRKALRMEYFYRDMRRQTGLLMDGDKPVGGQWNFDSSNRKPAKADLLMPRPLGFIPDAISTACIDSVRTHFANNFGDLEPFDLAVDRTGALKALDHFVSHALPSFGDFQDAMLDGEAFLYHSHLSQYLNVGLLDPLEMCKAAEAAYHSGHAPLNAVEGFIRQIIGWREFIRGVYWLYMPEYRDRNALGAERSLPPMYWGGPTKMACIADTVATTRRHAYAHHIQRLMITGNFAMLAGIAPAEVHQWYLSVYADAFEWVELPNTLGMSQYADGGIVGSKPYAAGGNYIQKMSNYCSGCHYDVKDRTSPRSCPFNALYWDFLDRHSDKFAKNPRMAMIYRSWQRFAPEMQDAIRARAAYILDHLDIL